jgi:metal-responsive CopG/Arc/MetJ family transcriptional regulator
MTANVVKLTVSVPAELVKMADKVARERKTSRSKVVSSCLQELAKKRFEAEL